MKLILALALISTAPASAAQNETQPATVYWRLMQRTGCGPLGGLVDEPRECMRIFAMRYRLRIRSGLAPNART